MKPLAYLGLFLLPLIPCNFARAAEPAAIPAAENWQRLVLSARVGFGMRDRDAAYQLHLGLLVEKPDWLLSFQAPLYGLMTDRGTSGRYPFMGLVKSHWDDVGDVGRVINEIRLGRQDGLAQLRVGRITGLTINNGSLVDDIYSQINPDASGLAISADFRSEQGHALSLLVVEPFHPALVAVSGSVHPLAPWLYGKNRTASALAVNIGAFVDPTILGSDINYGFGFEIEQGFFLKKVFIKPFNTYSYSLDRSNLGLGLEVGSSRAASLPVDFNLSLAIQIGQDSGQPVGIFYLLERERFPLPANGSTDYRATMDLYPKEWHGSVKGSLTISRPDSFLVQYKFLTNPHLEQFENVIHFQGSFFNRWTIGFFLAGKNYSPVIADSGDNWCWLASFETAFIIWRGLTVSGNYSYLINSDSIKFGYAANHFMINIGYEYGRLKAGGKRDSSKNSPAD